MNAIILAALMTPSLLYAGLAAAAIPVIIHLLSKRRFHKVRWAAIDWLLEADRRNRRRVRIEELILLALRCLAMFLIGAMLARVFLRPETLLAMIGSTARTERIIVLDDSYSMAAGGGGRGSGIGAQASEAAAAGGRQTVFERGKIAANRLLEWLRQECPGDAISVVLTSRPDRPLRSEASIANIDLAAWAAELDGLTPTSRAGNWPATFAAVRDSLEARKAASAAVYIVSDFQRRDWTPAKAPDDDAGESESGTRDASSREDPTASPSANAGKGQPSSPLNPLSALAGDGRHNIRIIFMDVGGGSPANLTLAAIEPQQAQAVATVSGAYAARIINHGDSLSQPALMRVFIGDAAQPVIPVPPIPPGQAAEVAFEVAFPNEGAEALTLELEPDLLPADDKRSLVVPVARALRILIVNGEPSADPYQDEAFLLTVALRPEGPQFSGNDVTVADENEFEATDLAAFHLVVLANVYHLSDETAARLEEYAASGGGVAIFVGDQSDPELYNRFLYRDGKGVLPARLGEVLSAPQDRPGVPFGEIHAAHPVMRRFRDSRVPFFAGVTAQRYIACDPVTTATRPSEPVAVSTRPETSVPAAEGNARLSDRPPAHVLLRAEDNERSPLIVERGFGRGKVVLVATSADKEWTNLPDRPAYVVLIMELVQYLARPAASGGPLHVGEAIHLPLDPGRFRMAATLKLPTFPEEPAITLEAQPDAEAGTPALHWTRTERPGIYSFGLLETSGAELIRPVAVNVDPGEGDLRKADRSALLAAAASLPVEYVAGEALAETDMQTRREVWPSLLVVLVTILMGEEALAWWFGSDRRLSALWGR